MLLGKLFVYLLLVVSVYLLLKGKEVAALLAGIAPITTVLLSSVSNNRPKSKKKTNT